MINKSVLIIGFGLAIAKSRQDESIFSYPYLLQSVEPIDIKVIHFSSDCALKYHGNVM